MIIPGPSPSDRELLSNYLLKKLKGETTEYPIPEIDVYAIEPWKLFSNHDEATSTSYFFTKNTKKNNGERMNRTVSTSLSSSSTKSQVVGTWKGQTISNKIKDEISDNIMGVRKMYTFVPKREHDEDEDDDDKLNGFSYIMHEYSANNSCYVLCRIRRKMKYSCSKNTVIRKNKQSSMRQQQQQQPVQSAAAVANALPLLIDVDEANKNTCFEENTAPSAFAQNFADMLLDTPTGTTVAQDVEDMLVPNAFAQDLLADNIIIRLRAVTSHDGVQIKKRN